ncbi:MAG: response regulator [Ignavibacterium sp.]
MEYNMSKILIIDDEPSVRFFYKLALRMQRYEIEEAEDGFVAIKKAKASNPFPEVILLDYRMPGKDGIQTAKEIFEINPNAKIIFISAEPRIKEKVLENGAVGFLNKPVEKQTLLETVSKVLSEN